MLLWHIYKIAHSSSELPRLSWDKNLHLNMFSRWFFFFFYLSFIYLFYFTILYWFCHALTWIHHGCTCVPHPESPSHLPPHPIPLGHPSAPALSTLSHASNLDWWFVSHVIICMFRCPSPISSRCCPLPQSPKDCSIHLTLLLSLIKGYHYHLSKLHICVSICVFLSGLLHSV